MSLRKATKKHREFHLKEPDRIIPIDTEIPRIVYPVGFCPQISYNSNKWNDDDEWIQYIHWWENPTLVCVAEEDLDEIEDVGFYSDMMFDIGPGRKEITFLGYAVDFDITPDDRSKIRINPSTIFARNHNPSKGEIERLHDSLKFSFNDEPDESLDYVACSPNGKIVYVIANDGQEVYAFINNRCRVTQHGIEG